MKKLTRLFSAFLVLCLVLMVAAPVPWAELAFAADAGDGGVQSQESVENIEPKETLPPSNQAAEIKWVSEADQAEYCRYVGLVVDGQIMANQYIPTGGGMDPGDTSYAPWDTVTVGVGVESINGSGNPYIIVDRQNTAVTVEVTKMWVTDPMLSWSSTGSQLETTQFSENGAMLYCDRELLAKNKSGYAEVFALVNYTIDGVKTTGATISMVYRVSGSEYEPVMGFYSSQTMSWDTYLSGDQDCSALTNGEVWLLQPGGFSDDEANRFTVLLNGQALIKDNGIIWKDNGEGKYNLCISIDPPAFGRTQMLEVRGYGIQVRFAMDKDHTAIPVGERYVGFSTDNRVAVPNTYYPSGGNMAPGTGSYAPWSAVSAEVFVQEPNPQGYMVYVQDTSGVVTVHVDKMWVTDPMLSWSSTASVMETTEFVSNSAQLYCSRTLLEANTTGYVEVFAQVDYTVGGDTIEDQTISMVYQITSDEYVPPEGFYSQREMDWSYAITTQDAINYFDYVGDTVWLLRSNGFTAEETQTIKVTWGDEESEDDLTQGQDWGWSSRQDGKYDLWVNLPTFSGFTKFLNIHVQDNGNWQLKYNMIFNGRDPYAHVGDYTIGFTIDALYESRGFNYIWGLENSGNGEAYTSALLQFKLRAGIEKTDYKGDVYYEMDDGSKVELTTKRIWLEYAEGAEGAVSLSRDGYVTELRGSYAARDQVQVYTKGNADAWYILWAEVEISVNGKSPVTKLVAMPLQHDPDASGIMSFTRPQEDTVAQLQADLADIAAQAAEYRKNNPDKSLHVDIMLADLEYSGTIQIPEEFRTYGTNNDATFLLLRFYGNSSGQTTLIGGMNLGGAPLVYVDNVHFKAPADEGGEHKALFNGGGGVSNCTFQGYDVAVESTVGYIDSFDGNVYLDNQVAIRLDTESATFNALEPWYNNTFIRNQTAVQILSLSFYTPYNVRLYNNNFISNNCDFDVQIPGTFYFYRNYYGDTKGYVQNWSEIAGANTEKKINNMFHQRAAKVEKAAGNATKVICNPRLKYPVKNWWSFHVAIDMVFSGNAPTPTVTTFDLETEAETEYANYLTSDWEAETQIVSEEAEELLLDPKAFEAQGSKEITVVDKSEEYLGSWIFD